jgi:hypothetical protein
VANSFQGTILSPSAKLVKLNPSSLKYFDTNAFARTTLTGKAV